MKQGKKVLSLVLCLMFLISTVTLGSVSVSAEDTEEEYNVGDIIEFGSYPQSRVTQNSLITTLNYSISDDDWKSFEYYSGDGYGTMKPGQWMRYADTEYNNVKYRAVRFDYYRPYFVVDPANTRTDTTKYQLVNGYDYNNTYWFKYEPLTWTIIDAEKRIVVCNSVIDSQPYNNCLYNINGNFYNDNGTNYANNWEHSSIREWLNADFYNTAFSNYEKSKISPMQNSNLCYQTIIGEIGYEYLDSDATTDSVFLLSYDELVYSSIDNLNTVQATDYAKCQGVEVESNSATWLLRTPAGEASYNVNAVRSDKDSSIGQWYSICTFTGTRPALALSDYTIYKCGDIIKYGSYPQCRVDDEETLASLNALVSNDDWVSYGYYSGPGVFNLDTGLDGEMTSSDYMRFADVSCNGEKYRAVIFDSYRPFNTGCLPNENSSYQDDNGYETGEIYWFKYEPIVWRILDEDTGLLMCNTLIDCQPFNNYVRWMYTYTYYGSPTEAYYANNYEYSSIRIWLNNDFYNTAFSESEQSNIKTTPLDNRGYHTILGNSEGVEVIYSPYNDTEDKVFLLSFNDIRNSGYGFNDDYCSEDNNRIMQGTDYSKCQGQYQSEQEGYIGNSYWWLRTPYDSKTEQACEITQYGTCVGCARVNDTRGICPAICVDEIHNESDAVIENEVDATCTEKGSYDKVYYCSVCGDEIRRETYETPATGIHSWKYSTDKYTITASCEKCTESFSVTAVLPDNLKCSDTPKEITLEGNVPEGFFTTVSYSTDDGQAPKNAGTYSAHVYLTPDDLSDVILASIDIELKIEHDLTSHEGKAATCEEDGYEPYVDCNCGYTTYTTIPAKNHNYSVSYKWSDDGKSCVATAVCTNDSQHTFREEATIGKSVKVNPTCTEPGITTYTASFSNKFFVAQTKDVADIPPKEHNYIASYEWSDDGKSCVATAVCANDSQHTFTENAVISSSKKTEPTCTENGTTTYTASFTNELFSEQTKDVADIPPKEHNYAVSYEWSDDGKSCIATAICANDSQHTFSENATIGKAVKDNPTCTKTGISTYTASFDNKLFTAQTKDVTDIPAKGHVVIIKNATDPTCTVPGYTGTEFCSVCNQPLRTGEEIQPLGHSFTNYIYNNNATYEKDGTETAKCDRCNETYTRIKPGTKLINPTAKAKINVAAPITLDYRTKVTIKATASNLDPAYHLVLCINGKEYEGNNKEVSHNYGEIKGDINYFVKIVDASGKIQKDANGAELKKDGGKITCNAGFFQKIIAFFKGLFNALPEKTVKP